MVRVVKGPAAKPLPKKPEMVRVYEFWVMVNGKLTRIGEYLSEIQRDQEAARYKWENEGCGQIFKTCPLRRKVS